VSYRLILDPFCEKSVAIEKWWCDTRHALMA
jgi:hypothetical protein